MSKIRPVSGFPEWLPPDRIVEQRFVDTIRATFELHGFASVETRSVEPVDVLLSKGEVDHEIYGLRRLQADAGDDATGLALHYDLTVPFARYVLEHAGKLDFPFRRYQIQRCWRGERPQEGRYREFTQADVDVVDRDTLSAHFEVEMPLVAAEALRRLPVPDFRIQVNNRKIAEGFYRGLGLSDPVPVLRVVDKLDKVGPEVVARLLVDDVGATEAQARACLALARINSGDASFADRVLSLGVSDPTLASGLEELTAVMDAAVEHAPGLLVADLKVARGLDYYTGTVYETRLVGHETLGSVCSGGRYESLASDGHVSYPGVGISIGVSRLLGRLLGGRLVAATRSTPTCVLVALPDEQTRRDCMRTAARLRSRGIPTEVSATAARYGKQIRFAERRGIPFVWFPQGDGTHQVRDIRTGTQQGSDPDTWSPADEDRFPAVSATTSAALS